MSTVGIAGNCYRSKGCEPTEDAGDREGQASDPDFDFSHSHLLGLMVVELNYGWEGPLTDPSLVRR